MGCCRSAFRTFVSCARPTWRSSRRPRPICIAKLAAGIADDLLDGRAARGAHSAHPGAGDERSDVRRFRDASESRGTARARIRNRRARARLSRRARGRRRASSCGRAHHRSSRARGSAPPDSARQTRGNYGRTDARGLRSGALFEQRVDRRDGHCARSRSGAARRARYLVARPDSARSARRRRRRAHHDRATSCTMRRCSTRSAQT